MQKGTTLSETLAESQISIPGQMEVNISV